MPTQNVRFALNIKRKRRETIKESCYQIPEKRVTRNLGAVQLLSTAVVAVVAAGSLGSRGKIVPPMHNIGEKEREKRIREKREKEEERGRERKNGLKIRVWIKLQLFQPTAYCIHIFSLYYSVLNWTHTHTQYRQPSALPASIHKLHDKIA